MSVPPRLSLCACCLGVGSTGCNDPRSILGLGAFRAISVSFGFMGGPGWRGMRVIYIGRLNGVTVCGRHVLTYDGSTHPSRTQCNPQPQECHQPTTNVSIYLLIFTTTTTTTKATSSSYPPSLPHIHSFSIIYLYFIYISLSHTLSL